MTVSSYLKYNDPIRIIWRAGTVEDPYVAKSESWKIINNKIFLSEVPDSVNRVIIDGYIEVNDINQTLLSNQFRVNYQNAMIEFNQSEEGKSINTSYQGRGVILYPAERIYVHNDNPDVVLTLQDIADNNQDTINLQAELIQIRDDANTAVSNANTAADNANATNNAITLAENNRVTAENVRESNEYTRQNNESTRESNELARIDSENNRLNSETVRENNESQRISNETIRQSNETTRQNNTTTAINNAETATANANNAANLAQNLVNTSIHLSDYNAATQYVINNEVSYQGSTYRCILDSFGNAPTDTIYWVLVAAKGLDGTGTGDMSKSTYDTNNDGIVDLADDTNKFGGKLPSEYSSSSHTHSELHSHTNKVELDRIGIDINNNLTIDDIPYESGASIDDVSISPNTTWSSENISNKIGILTNLQTTEKTNLVGAINEINTELNSPEVSSLLIQNSSIFSTGTGKLEDGTDVTTPLKVVEGQISDIGIKGKTASNVFKDGIFDSLTGLDQSGGLLLALDTANKVFGTNGLKMTLSGVTSSYSYKNLLSVMDKTKYYCISGYLKNGNATNVRLYFNPVGQIVKAGSLISDTTKFTRDFIKIQPSDFNNATMLRVGALVTGADTQYAYLDGVMVYEITQAQYNDSNFSPIPFINGTKSTVNSKVVSRSKNKLDIDDFIANSSKSASTLSRIENGLKIKSDSTGTYRTAYRQYKLIVGKTVVVKAEANRIIGTSGGLLTITNSAGQTISTSLAIYPTPTVRTTVPQDGIIRVWLYATATTSESGEVDYNNIQLEYNDLPTTYEPYKDSPTLINWTDGEGRSLPNGTYDEIKDGKEYKRTKKKVLASGDIINLNTVASINFDIVQISKPTDSNSYNNSNVQNGQSLLESYSFGSFIDNSSMVNKLFTSTSVLYGLAVAKGTYATLADAQNALAGTSVIYQLANEVVTDVDGFVPLVGFTDGDIYIEPQDDTITEFVSPTFEYKVEQNKAAQIDGNTAMNRQNAEEILRIYARLEVAGI